MHSASSARPSGRARQYPQRSRCFARGDVTRRRPDHPGPAAAKPATPAKEEVVTLEAFTVTSGFSGSLAAAAEIKQKQPLISEVVAAEDIGKLPDVSIAESLTRLPGLTTQRLNGRARAIVIRGLNGDFSTALLNGREQVSASAGRSVEFDQYPAELLSGVQVYKSTDASLVGQGWPALSTCRRSARSPMVAAPSR
jgi:iron complex outermembrane receptor protein